MEDLNRSIALLETTLIDTPPDHRVRPLLLNPLGNQLCERFELTYDKSDLDRSIDIFSMAVTTNLGSKLMRRYKTAGNPSKEDLEQALLSFKNCWNCLNGRPWARIGGARNAAIILASSFNWEEASQLLHDAMDFLPILSPRSLQHSDKQYILRQIAGMASMAAAIALNAGKESYHALKLLELGRGVIANFLFEMRTDISALKKEFPELALKFTNARDTLDIEAILPVSDDGDVSSWAPQTQSRFAAEEEFKNVIATIRAQEGFKNFLRLPSVDELLEVVGSATVVVINVSSYRCDTFLIEGKHGLRLVELPELNLKEIEEQVQNLRSTQPYLESSILEWLWEVIASPILETLGFDQTPSDEKWPHIWWTITTNLTDGKEAII